MAGILLVLCCCLDFFITNKLQHNSGKKYGDWNNIIHTQLNTGVVIMGSSRGWIQYDPFIIDSILHTNSYNIGIDGSHLNRQIMKYNVFAHYQKMKPKTIIVNIDYVSALSTWSIGYQREQFFPYIFMPFMREQICYVEPFSWKELYLPVYRYTTYKGLFAMLQEAFTDKITLYKGYKGRDGSWDGVAYNQIDTVHFELNERTLRMFEEFLEERYKENIQVIFCYAPIYTGLTAKVDNLQEVYDTYQSLADRYGIPILDYNYAEICTDTTYFCNATHLNTQGAELFSTQLAHDLDSLGLISGK